MSTKEEQIALLNTEKQTNIEAIDLLNKQIKGLDQAIVNTQATVDEFKVRIETSNADIARLTNDNATLDDIITTIGG